MAIWEWRTALETYQVKPDYPLNEGDTWVPNGVIKGTQHCTYPCESPDELMVFTGYCIRLPRRIFSDVEKRRAHKDKAP